MPVRNSTSRSVPALRAGGFGVVALVVLLVPASVAGQGAERGKCTLIWEPTTAATRSVSIREGQDAYITYVSGGMLWTCGTATMRADSAVKYDLARRVDMIGNVRYRDTIRTLESQFLTYFELDDRVIATDSVHLTRLGDGSTLTGPRVEFLRAVSGVDEQTIATGRPHMVLYPEGDDPGPPFDVDADRALFAGEEEARAFGSVVITRPDLRAEADSATFRIPEGSGVLYGSPWVEAEDITLRGDTIRTGFEDNVLRDVHALGAAHARGESFEVRSTRIDVAVEDDEVDAVWAHGEGVAEAISGDQHLYGDSLRFAMFEGRLDTINAVGRAVAVQGAGPARFDAEVSTEGVTEPIGELPVAPSEDSIGVDRSLAEDPVRVREPVVDDSVPTLAAVAEDSLRSPEPVASDSARFLGPIEEDSVRAPTEPPPDSAATPDAAEPEEDRGEGAAPTAAREAADPVEAGQADADTISRPKPDRSATSSGPRLPTDEDSNWVTGDTLYAIFERTPREAAAGPPDSARVSGIAADSVASPIPVDSAVAAPARPDSTADPVLERLTVIGHARSLYAEVRDSAATTRPSRNYMIGSRIDIFFRDGEPERVEGTDAIGLYLEPLETSDGQQAQGGLVPVPLDTTGVGAPEDTTSVPAGEDTTRVPPPDSSSRASERSRGIRTPVAVSATDSPRGARRDVPDRPPRDPLRSERSGSEDPRPSRTRSTPTPSRILT